MPDDAQFNYSAVWSNDGKRLVMLRGYATAGDGDNVAAVVPADGSGPGLETARSLFPDQSLDFAWAPDDTSVVVVRHRPRRGPRGPAPGSADRRDPPRAVLRVNEPELAATRCSAPRERAAGPAIRAGHRRILRLPRSRRATLETWTCTSSGPSPPPPSERRSMPSWVLPSRAGSAVRGDPASKATRPEAARHARARGPSCSRHSMRSRIGWAGSASRHSTTSRAGLPWHRPRRTASRRSTRCSPPAAAAGRGPRLR